MSAQLKLSNEKYTHRILLFLKDIGLEVREGTRPGKPFMPGIWVEEGALVVDRESLLYPGDLLHEAGHLAVMPPERRGKAGGNIAVDPGEEMAAQAWSYAAALAADIPLHILFHDNGYRGSGPWLREHFSQEGMLGVPLLVWYGMTHMPGPNISDGASDGTAIFPKLSTWLRKTPHPPYPAD